MNGTSPALPLRCLASAPYQTRTRSWKVGRWALFHHSSFSDDARAGFEWDKLPDDSVVVDVGGGNGSQALLITRNFPNLRVVVQDREGVTPQTVAFWTKQGMASFLDSGRATVQGRHALLLLPPTYLHIRPGHDFFTPQPVKNAAIFYLRRILHNWTDARCTEILRHLRAAATPNSRLVVQDYILLHACEDPASSAFAHGLLPAPPAPVLTNWGAANSYPYYVDMMVPALAFCPLCLR
jgi:hypothetical protein